LLEEHRLQCWHLQLCHQLWLLLLLLLLVLLVLIMRVLEVRCSPGSGKLTCCCCCRSGLEPGRDNCSKFCLSLLCSSSSSRCRACCCAHSHTLGCRGCTCITLLLLLLLQGPFDQQCSTSCCCCCCCCCCCSRTSHSWHLQLHDATCRQALLLQLLLLLRRLQQLLLVQGGSGDIHSRLINLQIHLLLLVREVLHTASTTTTSSNRWLWC
jgi:hypothetical protein